MFRRTPARMIGLPACAGMVLLSSCAVPGGPEPGADDAANGTPVTAPAATAEEPGTSDETAASDEDVAVARYEQSQRGGDSALAEGRLRVDEGGCLVMDLDMDGMTEEETVLPVFPSWGDPHWDEGLVFDGQRYEEGAHVSMGGGYHAQPSGERPGTLPDTCPADLTMLTVSQVG